MIESKEDKGKMVKSKYLIILLLVTLFLLPLLFPGQKINEEQLAEKYRQWLKTVAYIIHEKEKEVFLELATDRDRDLFIESFWKQRDPTPGTSQNEFREEHMKRFLYANEYFKRGSPREGWMTDMGRMSIILGPPSSIERFENTRGIYPAQVWSYYGDVAKGLPAHFSLVFYQKGGAGEYKLYDPVSDGPSNLMIDSRFTDPFDYEKVYKKIKELAPTLALVSLSLIPGEIPYNFQPSPQNSIILANILESPKKNLRPSYATHFLDYKGIVSTDYLTNYVESEAAVALVQDPVLGIHFVHFSIAPKSLSLDYYEPKDQYYANFRLDVSLRSGENILFQYSKDFPLYFPAQDIPKIRGSGISIEDSFPLIEGTYRLIVLLQNSVGKEFSVFEKDVSLPEDLGMPRIHGPFLGFAFESYQSNIHIPFKVLDKKLVVDPKNTFSSADEIALFFNITNFREDLWKEGEVKISLKGLREKNPLQKAFAIKLNTLTYNKILSITYTIPAKELIPDYYELKVVLENKDGETVDEKEATFVLSPEKVIPHPIINAKGFALSNQFLYLYILAHEYDRVNENEKAEHYYKKAHEQNPEYRAGLIDHANFLLKISKYENALKLVEGLKNDEKLRFDYFLLKGRAQMGMANYEEAIKSFLEGNKIYNSDLRLLNSLGFCYYKTGEKEKALEIFRASLQLNPKQEEIKKLLSEIEKSLTR